MAPVTGRVRSWVAAQPVRFATKHRLIGSSLLRLGLGILVVYTFASSWSERRYLWGAEGVHPMDAFGRTSASLGPSLFAVRSEPLFDVLYLAGLAAAVAYTLGWRTRLVAIPFAALTWSLLTRNPVMLNGGDTLLHVTLPYLVFLDASAYFSLDARRRRKSPRPQESGQVVAALHNLALVCLLVQLAIVYGFNFYNKMLGDTWPDGTALATVFRLTDYSPAIFTEFLQSNTLVQAVIAYFTLAFEAAYPILIWSRKGRVAAAALRSSCTWEL